MRQKRKLQIFVSSTFTDLKEERQAAVQAILTSGHIPAGMELFTAGDQSQMNVIKRWIDESDVFMLILGGRYGSIEPGTGKSYTELEYLYAVEKGMPFFAVVIDESYLEEKVKKYGTVMIEKENPALLKRFRSLVLSKMVQPYEDLKDIKITISEKLSEFSVTKELKGWIPGDQAITPVVTEQLGELTKENKELRKENEELRQKVFAPTFNGSTYEEMYDSLLKEHLPLEKFTDDSTLKLKQIASLFEDEVPAIIHFFWLIQNNVVGRWNREALSEHFYEQIKVLTFPFGLLKQETVEREIKVPKFPGQNFELPSTISITYFITMTEQGRGFLGRVHREKPAAKEAMKFLL